MEKVVKVGNVEIKMASTAGTLYRYRCQFKTDFLKDLKRLDDRLKQINKSKEENETAEFNAMDLEVFEQIAWSMAKTADRNIPDIEDWLNSFEMFDIYEALPQIMDLASSTWINKENEKKNLIPTEVQKL